MNQMIPRLVAAFAFALTALTAHAEIGVSNLDGLPVGGTYPTAGQLLGQSFSTDDSAALFNLDTVTLALAQTSGTVAGFSVSVYSDAGGLPSTSLGSLIGDTSPSAPDTTIQYYSYTTDSIILSANTTYWIVWGFTGPDDGGATTSGFAVIDGGSLGAWSLGQPAAAGDGSTWDLFEGGTPTPYGISITATAVPEPGASALIAGIFAIGLTTRRRRRNNRG